MITGDYNANSSSRLTQKKFFEVVDRKEKMGEPFSCKDFPPEKRDSFRQMVLRMKKQDKIELLEKSSLCFYQRKGAKTWNVKRKFTTKGMVVGTNMQEIFNEASKQIPTIHDIKIKFPSKQLHKNAIKQGMTPNKQNKGIVLEKLTLSRDIYAKITIYPESVLIDIGCTWEPIIYDIRGAQEFIGHVEIIRAYLFSQFRTTDMPDSLDWIVTHYHLNQDGQTEFSDESFHRTISDIVGGFIRIYAKKFPDNTTRIRLERIITPECSVKTQVNDMQNVGKFLDSEKRDISNIMPSEILSLNQFARTVEKLSSLYNPSQGGFFSL